MNDPRDSSSPFGAMDFMAWDHEKFGRHYLPADVEKSAALMQKAGVRFVRFNFQWEDLEPRPGHFDFAKYDRIVGILERYDVRLQAILAYNTPSSGQPWNHAPDVPAFCRYAQAVVDHFKDRIRHWEVWHEPDNPAFWVPQDDMQSYVQLMKYVYPLLKSVDPTCVVHLGGMSRSLPMSLRHVYEKGGKDVFDVLNIHPFANPLTHGALDAIRHMHKFVLRVMTEYGDAAKPIWFTEIGCPGMSDPNASPNWWLGANPNETVQAEWITTVYSELLTWKNVQKVFWCFFRDTDGHFACGSDYDGLIRHDFSLKPAFYAYQKMSQNYRTLEAVLPTSVADKRDTANPFGVLAFLDWNHDWNAKMYDAPEKVSKAVKAMADAGVGMVRQVISWDEVECKTSAFAYTQYDAILDALEKHNIQMLAVLCYTATCTGRAWNDAPDPELFGNYVRQTVRHYKDRIKYWEIWNEPDQSTYWKQQDGMKVYTDLVKLVYAIVKQEDPTAQVVLGSVSAAGPLLEMYRYGVKNYFDVINVHPFASPLREEAISQVKRIFDGVREAMMKYGDLQKPVWFTEIGCPGTAGSKNSKGWWLGKSPGEEEQARWVTTLYTEVLQWPGIQRIFWAFLQETQHFGDDIDTFGLIRKDFSSKPAFEAYRHAAQSWASRQPAPTRIKIPN